MSTNTSTLFPDINLAIEGSKNVNEICNKYIDMLNRTGNIGHIEYANKLLEYLEIDKKIPMFEDEFYEFKKYLRKWSQENGVNIFIKTRKKDFIGLNEKIRLFYSNPSKVNDIAGFRLVLKTPQQDTLESVELCYKLLNEVILFFVKEKKYTILEAEDLVDVAGTVPQNIIIPHKKNLILEGFENRVKDYIKSPKKGDFYQSLHCCIRTLSGLIFEVQIRTFAMNTRSDHTAYKKYRYEKTHINLELSKISLPGIAFDENNELVRDMSGLLKDLDLFNNI